MKKIILMIMLVMVMTGTVQATMPLICETAAIFGWRIHALNRACGTALEWSHDYWQPDPWDLWD